MVKVTVIIPNYNGETYLRECLDSVLSQTLTEIEVICVDDGSTDASLAILAEYAAFDKRFKVVKGAHKGGGAARNLGIKQGKGEYLSFLDSDDYMEPTMLEQMYEKATAAHADVCVCAVRFLYQATGALRDDESGLRCRYLPEQECFSYQDMPAHIFNTFHNWPWNKMFRYAFVKEKKLEFQELLRTNDLLFTNMALIEAKCITTVSEHLIVYRIDPSGTNSQMTNGVQLFGFYEAFAALKKYLEKKGVYQQLKQSFVNHALDGCIANLNLAEFGKNHQVLFERLKSEVFAKLDILDQADDYFHEFNKELPNLTRYRHIQKDDYLAYVTYLADELRISFRNLQYDIYHTDRRVEGMLGQQKGLQIEVYDLKIALNDVVDFFTNERDVVYESFSYRVGHRITKIPRWVGRKLNRR
jgi:glycosyltransferase EpsH